MEHELCLKEAKKMSKDNYEYFLQHRDELYREHPGKFVALKDMSVIGSYDSFDEAIRETAKTHPLGSFIVQQCAREGSDATVMFYSNNVAFC